METFSEWWQAIWTGSPIYITGQVIGLFCMVWAIFVHFPKKRETILKLKIIGDTLNMIQSGMIGATMGMVLNFIIVFRSFVFLQRGKKKWASHFFWLPFFLLVVAVSPTVSIVLGKEPWWLAIMPAAGSVITAIGYFQMNPNVTRCLAFIGSLPWLGYYIISHNLGGTLAEIILLTSLMVAIVVHLFENRRPGLAKTSDCPPEEQGEGEKNEL